MNDNPQPQPLSEEHRASLEKLADKLDGYVRLTRSGAGGLSQLRRELIGEIRQVRAMLIRDGVLRNTDGGTAP